MRRGTRILAAIGAAMLLAGCANADGVASQQGETGYVSGDGNVVEFPVAERGEPVVFGGTTSKGEELRYDGGVAVVNFWYASCPPCRLEAPLLASLDEHFGDNVAFIGVNTRDGAAQAQAFEDRFGITYPSVLDADTGAAQVAFAGDVAPNAVPSTLVLDASGRVAARISGALSDESILRTLVQDELDR